MGKRLERYKRRKKEKKIKRQKRIILLVTIMLFIGGINIVDKSFREFLYIEDMRVFDFRNNNEYITVHLLGKNYQIKEEKLDETISKFKVKLENTLNFIKNYIKN
ncbi:hypothetical protein BET03_02715 [Thermohalobacter berrensis]|uniref:Uncharacterized protein n=2 Tax=Thermohalobacter berrensis TaxID=99594 RepID=A0A419TBB1_9FIRM|nr:hypothetical protein BET03_02715 [Thermohalobacter berrensis]